RDVPERKRVQRRRRMTLTHRRYTGIASEAAYEIAEVRRSPFQRCACSWTTVGGRDGAPPVSVPTEMNPRIRSSRSDPQGGLHRLVIRSFASSPERAQSLSTRREHDAVGRATGAEDLLDDRNP